MVERGDVKGGPRIPRSGFLWSGFRKDLFIADVVTERPQFIESFSFALVTSLDSSPPTSLTNVRRALIEYVDEFREVGSGILLSGRQTVLLARKYLLFTHFDEVWLFHEAPIEPKPERASIVAPYDLSEEVPSEVADWMWRSGCVVGLGDGEGLNYVTVDERVARLFSAY
jgi:hypothetical protein